MALKSFGLNAVDWEQRVDFDRLRRDRVARLRSQLDRSDLGALLAFDFYNIRYMTATHIGTWAMDKLIRFSLLPRGGEPVIWDFGSAAKHHVLYNPWLDYGSGAEPGSRPGISTLRGAFNPKAGRAEEVARSIKRELDKYGLAGEPVGLDVAEMPILQALAQEGIAVTDGQQVFLEARRTKTEDEISLMVAAASMVDAAYDQLYAFCGLECAKTNASGWWQRPSTTLVASTSRGSTPYPVSAAHRIPMFTATASFALATRPSSTSCTRSTATGPATTARLP